EAARRQRRGGRDQALHSAAARSEPLADRAIVLSRAFVTILYLTADCGQCTIRQSGRPIRPELPDDSFESGKPTDRPGKRKNISIGHCGERHKADTINS